MGGHGPSRDSALPDVRHQSGHFAQIEPGWDTSGRRSSRGGLLRQFLFSGIHETHDAAPTPSTGDRLVEEADIRSTERVQDCAPRPDRNLGRILLSRDDGVAREPSLEAEPILRPPDKFAGCPDHGSCQYHAPDVGTGRNKR